MDVLVHLLHRAERDLMLIGTSTPLSNGNYELYMQRRVIDDDDQMMVSRILVITCKDEKALLSSLSEQLDHLLESGWHMHDWEPSPVEVPAPDQDPVSAFDDAMRLFIAASATDEE